MANRLITQTPAITISMTNVQVGLKMPLNQVSIICDIEEKLNISPPHPQKGGLKKLPNILKCFS